MPYGDNSFDQAVYLQQIICFIDSNFKRERALKEVYRIVKKGGVVIFSFLCFDGRFSQPKYFIFLTYLYLIKRILFSKREMQSIPWLKHNNRPNLSFLNDRGPYNYWYKVQELLDVLHAVGFEVIALESDIAELDLNGNSSSWNAKLTDTVYVVCRK